VTKCGEVIEKPEEGWVEWLTENGTLKKGDFKIVHHIAASPLREKGRDCYHYSRVESQNSELRYLCGLDGLAELSAWVYSPGVKDPAEWAETFRRLQVPHYEEARRYWQIAQSDDYFDGMDEVGRYSQLVLNEIIQQFGSEE
jgi:hypothetical protein